MFFGLFCRVRTSWGRGGAQDRVPRSCVAPCNYVLMVRYELRQAARTHLGSGHLMAASDPANLANRTSPIQAVIWIRILPFRSFRIRI
jgi:hypothetical protein